MDAQVRVLEFARPTLCVIEMRTPGPMVRPSNWAMSRTQSTTSTGSSLSSCLRAKASMRWVSDAPRIAPWMALSSRR